MVQKKYEKYADHYRTTLIIASLFCLIILSLFLMYLKTGITGKVIVSLKTAQYYVNETISGTINLKIEQDEFLPAGTTVKAKLDEKENSFTLEQLISSSGIGIEKKQGNFSVKNMNISGEGQGYGIEGGGVISLNLLDFNLKAEKEGKSALTISLEYNDTVILSEEKKLQIKTCVPNWKQYNTSCQKDDTFTAYYKDNNKCYEKTGDESALASRPNNITYACDYCTPEWKQKNTSCQKNDTLTAYYIDTKKCYEKTGLDSDLLGKPENATLSCDYCKLNLSQYNTTCSINDTYTVWYKDNNNCYKKTGLESDKVPANATLSCDYCTPNLTQYNTSCSVNDSFTAWYNDSNKCYEKTSLESDKVPENVAYSCDYCLPNWNAVNTSCLPGDMIITWYNDSNECYSKTNLSSDLLGMPANKTYKLACDYEGNNILGNLADINTTIKNLSLMIAKSADLTKPFTDLQEIVIKENGSELLEFNFNFSLARLNLANLIIQKQAENETKGFVVVKGVNITGNETKTIWLDRLVNGASVCVKDEENVNAADITATCNGTNEILVRCPGSTAGYTCEFNSILKKYKISGLKHSVVQEQEAFCGDGSCNAQEDCSSCSIDCGECPAPAPSAGGGGTPAGGCTPQWECSEWSECINGKQTRTCTNLKPYCPINKPAETKECEMQEKPEEIPKPSENITTQETQPTPETPQAAGGIIGAVIGIIGLMPAGLKIAVLIQIITLITILIIALTFLRMITKGRKFEVVPLTSESLTRFSDNVEQSQQNSKDSDSDISTNVK